MWGCDDIVHTEQQFAIVLVAEGRGNVLLLTADDTIVGRVKVGEDELHLILDIGIDGAKKCSYKHVLSDIGQ